MINIEIPEADLIVRRKELNKIPKHKGGVYFLFNESDELLYVGQTEDLKTRIYAHFIGVTNTSRFHKHFEYSKMFYEENVINREIYEFYLINLEKPILNVMKKRNSMPSNEHIRVRSTKQRCKGIRNDGERCNGYAHANGYCHIHGGNGVTYSSIREKAIKKLIEEEGIIV